MPIHSRDIDRENGVDPYTTERIEARRYHKIIADAIAGDESDHVAAKVLQRLADEGFAIVPVCLQDSVIIELSKDFDDRKGEQSYRDIWSVALKSARELA